MPVGLVLEGGGMRGAFTAGALTALYMEDIPVDYVAGVSAGALNAVSYISGQPERNYRIFHDYISDDRYVSGKNLIKTGSLFGFDFMLKELSREILPVDIDAFEKSKKKFWVGTTDCNTGRSRWFPKEEVTGDFDVLRASSSLPFVAHIVKYKGFELMDGGIAEPIPIEKSLNDGNDKNIIILTKNKKYKPSKRHMRITIERAYGEYPNFVNAIMERQQAYQREFEMCEELDSSGKAVIVRPIEELEVETYTRDTRKVVNLYYEGFYSCMMQMKRIRQLVERS